MNHDLFDRIMAWKHHPKVVVLLSYIGAAFFVPITGWTDLVTLFIVGTIIAIPGTLLLFFPYLIFISILALLLSLLRAIATGCRRSYPSNQSSPTR